MTLRAITVNKEVYKKAIDAPEEILKLKKVHIDLFLPPTDIPYLVTANFEEKKDRFIISSKLCMHCLYENSEICMIIVGGSIYYNVFF